MRSPLTRGATVTPESATGAAFAAVNRRCTNGREFPGRLPSTAFFPREISGNGLAMLHLRRQRCCRSSKEGGRQVGQTARGVADP